MSHSVGKNVKTTEGFYTLTYLWSHRRFPWYSSVFPETVFKKGQERLFSSNCQNLNPCPITTSVPETSQNIPSPISTVLRKNRPLCVVFPLPARNTAISNSVAMPTAHSRSIHSQCPHPTKLISGRHETSHQLYVLVWSHSSHLSLWPLTLLRHHGYRSRAATADYDNSKLTKTRHRRHKTTRRTSTIITMLWIRCVWSRNCLGIINIPVCIT